MDPQEMKLPELEQSAITSNVLLRREWVMDPPPWIMQRLPEDLVVNIYRIKMEGIAEIAELESQMKVVEAKVYRGIAEVIG